MTLLAGLLMGSNVWGETLITPENFSTLVDGAYVSLQCRDTNGGAGYYLNGGNPKSSTFSYANIYQLVTKGEGLALKNVKTGKYIGNVSNLAADVDEASAVSFTILNKQIDGFTINSWTTQMDGNVEANTCRFKTGSNFLNTNDKGSKPKYASGTGGYSIWYVYTYTQAEVTLLSLETGIYRIKNEYNGRGELVYNESYSNVVLNNITLSGYAKNNVAPTGNGTYWYVRSYNGKLYIYNVEANKFMQNNSDAVVYSATVNDQCGFTIDCQTASETSYFRVISPTSNSKYLSTSCGWEPGPNQVKFREHEAASDYLSFIVDEGEDMVKYAEQVEAANNLIEGLVAVTYNYIYGGETVKAESFTVVSGATRPTGTIPYACTADYSAVPETITAEGTYDIPVTTTDDFPFQFSTDYASAKWYTWYMRNNQQKGGATGGYAYCDGTNFPEYHLDAQPTEAKYLYAFVGNPYAIKVLIPNGKYMVNNGGANEKSTFGETGTEFTLIANKGTYGDITFVSEGKVGSINDVQSHIGWWQHNNSLTDGGSQVKIEACDMNVYQIVFAEGAPVAGGVVFNEVTYSVNGGFNAVSSATELNADQFEGVAVDGYASSVAISGRTVTVTYTATKTAAWLALSNLIYEAEHMSLPTEGPWGTDPGYYNQAGVQALPAAITTAQGVLATTTTDDVYEAATTTLQAAVNAAKMIMPIVGKTYQFINAFPTFESTHGYKMAIYSTGSVMKWQGVNNNSMTCYWTATAVDGMNVTFQNLNDDKYPSTYNIQNQPIPMQTDENACRLASLGEGQFNIYSGASTNPFHAGNHGGGTSTNGNVMVWAAGLNTCSSWYIHEAEFDYKAAVQVYQGVTKMNASSDPEVTVTYPDELKPYTPAQVDAAIDSMKAIDVATATNDEMKTALRAYAPAIDTYTSIVAAYGALVTVNYEFAAEYGTILMPCNAGKPEGMTIYTCAGVKEDGATLDLVEANSFSNQKPYIVQGTAGDKFQFIGYDKTPADKSTIVTVGLLNGVYQATTAPVDSYVLQNNGGKLGFYHVAESEEPTVGANRCYVTLPDPSVKALYFDEETGISSVDATSTGSATDAIYNLAGQRINKLQKGINIVNGNKVLY